MMTFQDSYNPKIDFRFLAFTNMNINQYESTYNLRKVFNEEMEAITKDQIDLIKSKQAFKILKQEGINNKSLKKCLMLFDVCIPRCRIQSLINYSNELDNQDFFDYACKLFIYIIKESLFNSLNNKMAILIFNSILYMNKALPIIVYPHNMQSLIQLINSGLSLEGLKEFMKKMSSISDKYNTKHKMVSRDDIISILLKNKTNMEQEFYVNHVTLTGSYVNGLYTEYSDADLIIDMTDKDKKKELENYLVNLFKVPVDIVLSDDDFTNAEDLRRFRIGVF